MIRSGNFDSAVLKGRLTCVGRLSYFEWTLPCAEGCLKGFGDRCLLVLFHLSKNESVSSPCLGQRLNAVAASKSNLQHLLIVQLLFVEFIREPSVICPVKVNDEIR